MDRIKDYEIVEGRLNAVNETVKDLVKLGWTINGRLMERTVDGTTIYAQSMILPLDQESLTECYPIQSGLFRFTVRANFDLEYKKLPSVRYSYTPETNSKHEHGHVYIYDVIGNDAYDAEDNLMADVEKIRTSDLDSFQITRQILEE